MSEQKIPTSIPTDPPPPPGQQLYTLGDLVTVPIWSRDSYRQAFGIEPPDFDPSLPPKRWFDSRPAAEGEAFRTYYTVAAGADGKPAYQSFSLPIQIAQTVNLAGAHQYAKWEPRPTGAKIGNAFGGWNPINPIDLSTRDQADKLAAELGGEVEEMNFVVFSIAYPENEDRREWLIVMPNGNKLNAGRLLNEQYSAGVGAPGEWSRTIEGDPLWIKQVPPAPVESKLPEVPRPMRALVTGESFRMDGFTGQIRVQMGALAVDTTGFLPSDRATLAMIQAGVADVRKLVLEAMGRK